MALASEPSISMTRLTSTHTGSNGTPSCETCDYHVAKDWPGCSRSHYCTHPRARSIISGTGVSAVDVRSPSGVCGPSGDLHSRRPLGQRGPEFWTRQQ